MQATHSYASDSQICKNKQRFFDFWAISYRFVHIHINYKSNVFGFIDYNIIAICLRGALLNNFERGRDLSPQSPPSARACI